MCIPDRKIASCASEVVQVHCIYLIPCFLLIQLLKQSPVAKTFSSTVKVQTVNQKSALIQARTSLQDENMLAPVQNHWE